SHEPTTASSASMTEAELDELTRCSQDAEIPGRDPNCGSGNNDEAEEDGVGFNLSSDDNNADADALSAAINKGVNDKTVGGDGGAGSDLDFNAGANVVFASNNFFVQPSNLSQRDRLYL
ncbi:hypothetical protein HDU79_000267, partial [Rhizoclosmatium sp. JEL0117]